MMYLYTLNCCKPIRIHRLCGFEMVSCDVVKGEVIVVAYGHTWSTVCFWLEGRHACMCLWLKGQHGLMMLKSCI